MVYHEGIKVVFLLALILDSLGTLVFLQYYINHCLNDQLVVSFLWYLKGAICRKLGKFLEREGIKRILN